MPAANYCVMMKYIPLIIFRFMNILQHSCVWLYAGWVKLSISCFIVSLSLSFFVLFVDLLTKKEKTIGSLQTHIQLCSSLLFVAEFLYMQIDQII